MPITLDETTHTYTTPDGQVVPSVTQILADVGLIDCQWFTDQATFRGTFVHEATALDDRDDLDDDQLSDSLGGYVEAWRAFRRESKAAILSIEERVFNPTLAYAGTLDRRVMFRGCEWVIDIKTGGSLRWHALQTAAYASCVSAGPRHLSLPGPLKRATVHLRPNGRYSFLAHDDFQDFRLFEAAVALYHFKRK